MVVVSTFTVGWEGWVNRALDEPYKAYKAHTFSQKSNLLDSLNLNRHNLIRFTNGTLDMGWLLPLAFLIWVSFQDI